MFSGFLVAQNFYDVLRVRTDRRDKIPVETLIIAFKHFDIYIEVFINFIRLLKKRLVTFTYETFAGDTKKTVRKQDEHSCCIHHFLSCYVLPAIRNKCSACGQGVQGFALRNISFAVPVRRKMVLPEMAPVKWVSKICSMVRCRHYSPLRNRHIWLAASYKQ